MFREERPSIDIGVIGLEPSESLRRWADARGCAIAWGDAGLVPEVQDRIHEHHARGDFDEYFFVEAVAGILRPLAEPSGTVICVAVPRPAHRVVFETADGPFTAIAPPTYVEYGRTMDAVQRDIEAMLQPARVRSLAWKPLKSLAVRLGLAKYGRNNLTYTPQTGSHHELAAFVVDTELQPWPGLQDPETIMPRCTTCEACRRACPTGAIGSDRYLIHGERCLTFLNEYLAEWPAWLPGNVHSALIGCMRCIGACPANHGKLRIDDFGHVFTVEETEAILSGRTAENEPIWTSIADELAAEDSASWLDYPLSRNLKALMGTSPR